MPKIIISYRRAQNDAIAGRLRDRLVAHYGAAAVFMDVDNIPFGTDFRKHIDAALSEGDIVVAVIGPKWTGPQKGKKARVFDETDPVRVEIETAIKRGITVVPILVDGATMPKPAELPDTIRDLSFANAASVDAGRDFHQHMDRVMRSMDQILKVAPAPPVAKPVPSLRLWPAAAAAALVLLVAGTLAVAPGLREAIFGGSEAPAIAALRDNLPAAVQPNPADMGEAPPQGPAMDTLPLVDTEAAPVTPTNGDGRRVALIIANGAYEDAPALATAENDAGIVADAFSQIGYDVTRRTNLTREGLVSALHQFSRDATGAASAAFYYSGYGLELDGRNYLVPIDAVLLTDRDVAFEAVPFDRVQDAIAGAKEPRIIMVDASRGSPFESRMTRTAGTRSVGLGLAPVEPDSGSIVVFSAKPGTVAIDGNGPTSAFATALARRAVEPGVDIGIVLRLIRDDVLQATGGMQEPWTYGSLPAEEFLLAGPR